MVAKNGRAISTGSRGNFSTNTSRKAHRLGNADNCIPPFPPSEAIRDESPASMGAMGYGGVGVAFRPRLIQSEEEFTVYLRQARGNRFPAIISPTLRNDRAKPPPPPPSPHVFRLTRAFLYAIRPFFFLLIHIFISSRQIFARNFHHLLRTFLSKFGCRFRSPRENRRTTLKG